MHTPFRVEQDTVYDDGALVLGLGLTHAALRRARRSGELRYVRKGQRVLYRGAWVLEWLAGDEDVGDQYAGDS